MARYQGLRERIFSEHFDTLVDELPERLVFFKAPDISNDQKTDMLVAGGLPPDNTGVLFGARVLLMGESFDSQLVHELQQASLLLTIGMKHYGQWPLVAVKQIDAPHGRLQAAYAVTFGEDPPAAFEMRWNNALNQPTSQEEFDRLMSEYEKERAEYRPTVVARQGFSVQLVTSARFREIWRATHGHKALRVTLRLVETRDVQ